MTGPHEWLKNPAYPPMDPVWSHVNRDVMASLTKCENCGAYILRHDDKWWEMVSWDIDRSTWRTHTPERCRKRRANGQKEA